MKFEFRHLLQIEAIARHQNFAKAAKELNISQPGISQSIRLLEDQLGYKLFDRNVRKVTPTVFGKRAVELGQPIIQEAEHLGRELKMMAKLENGLIRFGVAPVASEVMLSRILARLAEDYPGLTIEASVALGPALIEDLRNDKLDIIVSDTRFYTENLDELNFSALPQYEVCFICRSGHPLARQKQVTFRDIFDFPIACPLPPKPFVLALAHLSGLSFTTINEFPNGHIIAPIHFLNDTIVRCDAVGISLKPIVLKELKDSDVHFLPLQTPKLATHYEIISIKRYTLSPAVQVLENQIKVVCRELMAEHLESGLI